MNHQAEFIHNLLATSDYHRSWHNILHRACSTLDSRYLHHLFSSENWLPGINRIFNAFRTPKPEVRYILFGESPYPRKISANGYAFWDAAVNELWSPEGFSKAVNRATSLRNWLKMLLVAADLLSPSDTSQPAIAKLNKTTYVTTLSDVFNHLLEHGFLLLNASLVLSDKPKSHDASAWLPFIESILSDLTRHTQKIDLILLGNIAKTILKLPSAHAFTCFTAEHPYNISFITNPEVIRYFKPFNLLQATKVTHGK